MVMVPTDGRHSTDGVMLLLHLRDLFVRHLAIERERDMCLGRAARRASRVIHSNLLEDGKDADAIGPARPDCSGFLPAVLFGNQDRGAFTCLAGRFEGCRDAEPGRQTSALARFYRRHIELARWLRVVVDYGEDPAWVVTAVMQDNDPRE